MPRATTFGAVALTRRLGLMAIAETDADIQLDPGLARPVDVPALVGDPGRLHDATGWEPGYELDETLADTLDWWREELASE